jgi:hypothetical protein
VRLDDYNRIALETSGARPIYRGAVLSIHGMNTYGPWQKVINTSLQDNFLRHVPVDYGYQIRRVTWPFTGGLLREVAEKIVAAYQDHERHALRVGAIGHSFGSLAIGAALRWNPDLNFPRIILFGSILPRSFPWDDLLAGGQVEKILHETCHIDPWPRIAPIFIAGSGASGCYGFRPTRAWVNERAYGWTEHSRLATSLHCSKVWVPFLHELSV